MNMKKLLPFLILALALGSAITYAGIRFAYQKEHPLVHFHANFAFYVDGKKVDFSSNKYMEEVSACTLSSDQTPRERVHLHENNGDAVHVHTNGVTWGNFLANIGFGANQFHLSSDDGKTYTATETSKIHFILNGKSVIDPINSFIKSEDRLLISYGPESETQLQQQFATVSNSAHQFNTKQDPASCKGSETNTSFTFWK